MLRKALAKFSRRPFPRNLQALRSCRVSYGQFGEDLFLTHLLGYEKTDGVYVDIGCYHPIDYSNTYIFYQRGWRGLAIDPNPDWKGEWERFRPRDIFINAAIAPSEGTMKYLMNRRYPACNRLITEAPSSISPDETCIDVVTCNINIVLDQYLPNARIDLLSVDCEGQDLEILRTLDFDRYWPSVIAAEEADPAGNAPLTRFLESRGYESKAQIGPTKIFQVLPR